MSKLLLMIGAEDRRRAYRKTSNMTRQDDDDDDDWTIGAENQGPVQSVRSPSLTADSMSVCPQAPGGVLASPPLQ